MRVTTAFGMVCLAAKLRFDVAGSALSQGHTAMKPASFESSAVTLRATAVATSALPVPAPTTRNLTVLSAGIFPRIPPVPSRVSIRRRGKTDTNGLLAADCAVTAPAARPRSISTLRSRSVAASAVAGDGIGGAALAWAGGVKIGSPAITSVMMPMPIPRLVVTGVSRSVYGRRQGIDRGRPAVVRSYSMFGTSAAAFGLITSRQPFSIVTLTAPPMPRLERPRLLHGCRVSPCSENSTPTVRTP